MIIIVAGMATLSLVGGVVACLIFPLLTRLLRRWVFLPYSCLPSLVLCPLLLQLSTAWLDYLSASTSSGIASWIGLALFLPVSVLVLLYLLGALFWDGSDRIALPVLVSLAIIGLIYLIWLTASALFLKGLAVVLALFNVSCYWRRQEDR